MSRAGAPFDAVEMRVSWRTALPSLFMPKISRSPSRALTKASLRPSGDQTAP
jgi:hypothetical protein